MNFKTKRYFFLCFLPFLFHQCFSQDSSACNSSCIKKLAVVETSVFTASSVGLYYAWYRPYAIEKFHFFNDFPEWNQMDKAGHIFTAYQLGNIGYRALRHCKVSEKKALLYGAPLGFVYLLPVEIMDGFSSGWGFSFSDIIANTAGTALFTVQQLAFDKQIVQLKMSFHPSPYADYRPDLLGETLPEQILKDYNGQTYWLSFSPFGEKSKFSFLQISAGYGAEGMTGGRENSHPAEVYFPRYRQYYLSLDINLSQIRTRKQWLNKVLSTLSLIKIPFPAVEWNTTRQIRWHWIYF